MNQVLERESTTKAQRWDRSDSRAGEPFVRPDVVGEFLGIGPATVVRLATAGQIPGYPLRLSGSRKHWRFLLSEVRKALVARVPGSNTEHRPAICQPTGTLQKGKTA